MLVTITHILVWHVKGNTLSLSQATLCFIKMRCNASICKFLLVINSLISFYDDLNNDVLEDD